jgi:glyoxylase-like metal-dependent hydrolase (beta-lactamase superfamily II)
VLTISFPGRLVDANCYVIAPAAGEECLIVDPGIGADEVVPEVLREHRLRPAAVLLTHGHIDHTYAVTPVSAGGTAAYVHTDDRYRLSDALSLLSPGLLAALEQQFGRKATWRDPDTVVELRDRQVLELAGLEVEVLHAPGHTEGSVIFRLPDVPDGVTGHVDVDTTAVTGDVLFAGSIGRTDLPGGDHDAMLRSLSDVVLPMSDTTLVLPGHGPATTMDRERATNPYLQGLGS